MQTFPNLHIRVARISPGEGVEGFLSLNLWLIKQLHHLAAEFWQEGVRSETLLDLTLKGAVDICFGPEFP